MKIRVSKDTFQRALQKVANIIGKNSTLPILSNILLEARGDELTIVTTDLEVRVTARIPVEVEREGATTIPAKKLSALVSKFIKDEIMLDCDEKHHTKICCGTASFMLLGLAPDDYPAVTEFTPVRSIKLDAGEVVRLFDKISYAVSLDDSRKVLHGVLCSVKENAFTAVATDGKRLALVEKILESFDGVDGDCIIPLKSANELKRILQGEETVTINIGEKMISFVTENTELSSTLIDGNYPNYKQVIPNSFSKSVTVDSSEFQSKLDLVSLALGDASAFVRLSFADNKLKFEAASTSIGEGCDFMDIEYDYPEVNISFNPVYLAAPFKHSDSDVITLKMNDGYSPVSIEGGEGFLYVIMPMRNK